MSDIIKCPKCDKDVREYNMDLYETHDNTNEIIREYCCTCPGCGHKFGVEKHYLYDCTEVSEEWD